MTQADGQNGISSPKFQPEILWTLQRIGTLLICWTTPVNSKVTTFTSDDGASARILALGLIAALAFAVRGETRPPDFAALVACLAIVLSTALNTVTRLIGVTLRDQIVLSGYTSTILVMIGYLLIDKAIDSQDWYIWIESVHGEVWVPAVAAGLIMLAGLIVKSVFWDKRPVSRPGIKHGILLTVGSIVILYIVKAMQSDTFSQLQKCILAPTPSCWLDSLHSFTKDLTI